MKLKTCTKCKKDLSPLAFNSHSKAKDGLQTQCRDCRNTNERERRAKNKKIRQATGTKKKLTLRERMALEDKIKANKPRYMVL